MHTIFVLQHALYGDSAPGWRTNDNLFIREDGDRRFTRQPPSHEEVSLLLEKSCQEYDKAAAASTITHLYFFPVFICDFVAIQPFEQGNFIMIRLLIHYLLKQAGFSIGEYISIENTLQRKAGDMFAAFAQSLIKWEHGTNDYSHVFNYIIYMLSDACRVFDFWAEYLTGGSVTKAGVIQKIIQIYGSEMSKRMIMEYAPNISESTVEAALRNLLKSGKVEKTGGGRYSKYRYIGPGN